MGLLGFSARFMGFMGLGILMDYPSMPPVFVDFGSLMYSLWQPDRDLALDM